MEPDPHGDASDAIIRLVADLTNDHDYGGPLARTLQHLGHLTPEVCRRIASLADELVGALQPIGAVHESPGFVAFQLQHYGIESLRPDREINDCQPCRASLPSWRPGVCHVCSALAEHEKSYYCSEEHRLENARAGYP